MRGHERTIEDEIAEQDSDHPSNHFPYSAMGDDIPDHLSPRQAMHYQREKSVHDAEAEAQLKRNR